MNRNLTETLVRAARRHKTDLWWVGGPVRDEWLCRSYDDWDMVCRKARSVATEAARRLGATFITLDEQNRIYRVILPEVLRPIHTLDFAEMQGRSIAEDLKRRDFTINAMAKVFPSGPVLDPLNGTRDLRKGVVRAVSEKAFVEDPLRLLRAYRFAAQFQFKIDPLTRRWIRKHREAISRAAPERIREELARLWKQPHAAPVLRWMDQAGLLARLFPEIEACRRTAVRYYGRGGVLKHSFETLENLEWILEQVRRNGRSAVTAGSAVTAALPLRQLQMYLNSPIGGAPRLAWLKWAAFLHDIGKPPTAKLLKGRLRFFEHEHRGAELVMQAAQRLRCSRQEVQLLGLWVRNHMRAGSLAAASGVTNKALARYFRDLGEEGVGMILLSLADHYTYLTKSSWGKGKDPVEKMAIRLLTSYYEERSKILPERLVNGHDLMRHLRLKPGPQVGKLLEAIQDAQVEGKVATKAEAISFAKKQRLP